MTGRAASDDLFARARAVPIEAIVPHPLRREGRRLVGPCPVCGGDARSTRFQLDRRANVWCCFACAPADGQRVAGGGPIELALRMTQAQSPREAAEWLVGLPSAWTRSRPDRAGGRDAPGCAARSSDHRRRRMQRLAREIWQGSDVATDGPHRRYLLARGIGADLVDAVLAAGRVRLHESAPAAWGRDGPILTTPAMVAPVVRPRLGEDGAWHWRLTGLHVTYLTPGGEAKAHLTDPRDGATLPAKRMFGSVAGAAVVLGLSAPMPASADPLIVGEGIETTLALMQACARLSRAVATLCLSNLQGGWRTDRSGAIDLDAPIADPERPPFLLTRPGEVWIGVDADMAPVTMRVRRPDRRVVERRLSAIERAELCARLTEQHWRRAGASRVRLLRPRAGADFADLAWEAAA